MNTPVSYQAASREREALVLEMKICDQAIASLDPRDKFGGQTRRTEFLDRRENLTTKKRRIEMRVIELNQWMKANDPSPALLNSVNVVPIVRRLLGVIDRLGGELSELERDVVDEAAEWLLAREQQSPGKYAVRATPTHAPAVSPRPVPAGDELRDYATAPPSAPAPAPSAPSSVAQQLAQWRAKTLPAKPLTTARTPTPPSDWPAVSAITGCVACGAAATSLSMCESCIHAVECHGATSSTASDIECGGACRRAKRATWDGARAVPAGYPGRPVPK